MKSVFMCSVLLVTSSLFGQARPINKVNKPVVSGVEAVADSNTLKLQDDSIQLAIKDYQLASYTLQFAQQKESESKQAVLSTINSVKVQRHLDNSWDYDFQKGTFVQKNQFPITKK